MQPSTYQRGLALSGILFVALIVVAFVITTNQVDESASPTKAFNYWNDHQTRRSSWRSSSMRRRWRLSSSAPGCAPACAAARARNPPPP